MTFRLRTKVLRGIAGVFSTALALVGFQTLDASDAYAFSPDYELGVEGQFYRDPANPTFFPVVSAGIRFSSHTDEAAPSEPNEYLGDFRIRLNPMNPQAYGWTSQNLYWGEKDQSDDSPIRFSFGRRKVEWTRLDTLWSLGQIEPLDQWDRFRPTLQGLTGIFAYTETHLFNFRFFFSALTIPETTPNVVLQDGTFSAVHPQGITSAPQTINILGQDTNTRYSLNIPSIDKILFRPSVMASIETKREFPFHAKLVYGFLPLNYFPIAIQGDYSHNLNIAEVNLIPRLLQHHVYNGEVSYRLEDHLSFGLVTLVDQPVSDAIPSDYTTTPLTPSLTWSPWIEYVRPNFSATLTQIWVSGGLSPDVGSLARTDGASVFSSRMLYRNASQLQFNKKFFAGSSIEPLLTFKYIHEYSIDGDWFASDLTLHLGQGWTVYGGGDVLSSYRNASPDLGAEFLADMRPLGRARIGVNYVF